MLLAIRKGTYMRHSRSDNFKVMEEWIEGNREGISVISGDFDARTATEGGLWDSEGEIEQRRSKDTVLNEEGKELVGWLEEQGLGIGNGATKGDEGGEWTQVGQRGCSTIDYVTRNEEGRRKIEEMIIGNRIKSDHAPIEMTIQWKDRTTGQEGVRKERRTRSIIKWEEGVEEFREKLRGYGRANSWEMLKDKVTKALPRVEVRGRREVYYEEKWWDGECHREKGKLKEALGKLRREEISEGEWRRMRREYRNLLERKKRDKGKEWVKEIEKDKGMKLFWKAVNSNERASYVEAQIPKDRWRDHFRGQYVLGDTEGSIGAGSREGEERELEGEQLEDINAEEVREVVKNLKKKKAAGHDQITNEA